MIEKEFQKMEQKKREERKKKELEQKRSIKAKTMVREEKSNESIKCIWNEIESISVIDSNLGLLSSRIFSSFLSLCLLFPSLSSLCLARNSFSDFVDSSHSSALVDFIQTSLLRTRSGDGNGNGNGKMERNGKMKKSRENLQISLVSNQFSSGFVDRLHSVLTGPLGIEMQLTIPISTDSGDRLRVGIDLTHNAISNEDRMRLQQLEQLHGDDTKQRYTIAFNVSNQREMWFRPRV